VVETLTHTTKTHDLKNTFALVAVCDLEQPSIDTGARSPTSGNIYTVLRDRTRWGRGGPCVRFGRTGCAFPTAYDLRTTANNEINKTNARHGGREIERVTREHLINSDYQRLLFTAHCGNRRLREPGRPPRVGVVNNNNNNHQLNTRLKRDDTTSEVQQ